MSAIYGKFWYCVTWWSWCLYTKLFSCYRLCSQFCPAFNSNQSAWQHYGFVNLTFWHSCCATAGGFRKQLLLICFYVSRPICTTLKTMLSRKVKSVACTSCSLVDLDYLKLVWKIKKYYWVVVFLEVIFWLNLLAAFVDPAYPWHCDQSNQLTRYLLQVFALKWEILKRPVLCLCINTSTTWCCDRGLNCRLFSPWASTLPLSYPAICIPLPLLLYIIMFIYYCCYTVYYYWYILLLYYIIIVLVWLLCRRRN